MKASYKIDNNSCLTITKGKVRLKPKGKFRTTGNNQLIFEVAETEKDKAGTLIKKQMESVVNLKAPLKVNIEFGKSWGSIH